MKYIPLVIISSILAALFVSCESQRLDNVSGKTIKIGFIGPMSGSDETWGKNGLLGCKIALQMQPFLMNGDKVELVIEDDQNTLEHAEKALRKLVEVDQVSAVLIMSDSQTVLGVAQNADIYKTPILALNATHPDVTDNNYVSQLVFNDTTQGTVAALYVIDELLIDHVAVFKDLSRPYSKFLADTFINKFEEAGGTVTMVEFAQGGKTHIESLEGLRDQGISFLYTPLTAEQILDIDLETQKIYWNPLVMASDGLLGQFVLQYSEHLDVVEGMLATDLYAFGLKKTEFGRKINKIYKKNFNKVATTFTLLGVEGTAIMIAAMNRCGNSSDRECINRSLRQTTDFEGFIGKISIKHTGQAERAIFINQILNEKLNFVVKVY
ncbi:MAG: ABC transporter substrate-binding protein [Desulfobacterales bacterium]|nr:ABC transporter substrate-binding protein [Desulfobacterales bacterium]